MSAQIDAFTVTTVWKHVTSRQDSGLEKNGRRCETTKDEGNGVRERRGRESGEIGVVVLFKRIRRARAENVIS